MYLLNTTIFATSEPDLSCRMTKISIDRASELLKSEFCSAIGHQSTAELLSQLLNIEVDMKRLQVGFKPGDLAIAFKTRYRAEEGKIYSFNELEEIEFDLFLMEFFDLKKLLTEVAEAYQHATSYASFGSTQLVLDDFM